MSRTSYWTIMFVLVFGSIFAAIFGECLRRPALADRPPTVKTLIKSSFDTRGCDLYEWREDITVIYLSNCHLEKL